MPDELRPDLVFAMADAVDKMLLSWEPPPSLSEALSALVQSLALYKILAEGLLLVLAFGTPVAGAERC